MIRNIFTNKTLLSTIVAAIYVFLALPVSEMVAFSEATHEAKGSFFVLIVKLIFFLVSFAIIRLSVYLLENRKKLTGFTKNWIKYGLINFAILFIFFILLYPGHWVWDEFNVLNEVKQYNPDPWQNIFTNIYYTVSLYFYPTGVSIVIAQISIIAAVIGYVFSVVRKYSKSRFLIYALYLVFLSPVIIINNFYPLRLTLYGYLELALLVLIVNSYLEKKLRAKSYLFIVSSLLLTIVCFWRTEGIIYLALLPLAAYRFNIFSGIKNREISAYVYLFLGLFIVTGGYLISNHYSSNRYALTAIINPLSVMIQSPLKGDSTPSDLETINNVIDLDIVKSQPSYSEVPSFWNNAVRSDSNGEISTVYPAFLNIVRNNPSLFLESRLKTFSAANSLDQNSFNPTFMSLLSYQEFPKDKSGTQEYKNSPLNPLVVENFYDANMGSRPLNYTLRHDISRTLLMLNEENRVSPIGSVVWSVIPVLLLLLLLFVFFLLKRVWVLLFITILLIAHAALVFLTAPASYFMYYIPVFLCGWVLILVIGIHLVRKFPKQVVSALKTL